ncbi:MAG: FAD-binding oxidoreductase, partial [Actinomycetes bacterium]
MTASTDTRRPGNAEDAVGGVVPREVVRPTSVEEVAEVLRAAAAEGRTVVPVGGRSKLSWAAPPSSCDLVLDTTGLDRIVEHVAGDLTVVAEAGVRLADLQEHVGQAGQMLGLDPPEEGATLGGVVSANASGPRRLQYGTVRDLLIGTTVVLADGTVAHAGGKVVKNVAGYDLGKLYTGAHGTLGVLVSTTWRLHPVPPARRVVTLERTDASDAGPLAIALNRSTLTPSAVELIGSARGPARLVVLFESIAESVADQARSAVALLGGGTESADLPPEFGRRP